MYLYIKPYIPISKLYVYETLYVTNQNDNKFFVNMQEHKRYKLNHNTTVTH
jgi:hypothetical protein